MSFIFAVATLIVGLWYLGGGRISLSKVNLSVCLNSLVYWLMPWLAVGISLGLAMWYDMVLYHIAVESVLSSMQSATVTVSSSGESSFWHTLYSFVVAFGGGTPLCTEVIGGSSVVAPVVMQEETFISFVAGECETWALGTGVMKLVFLAPVIPMVPMLSMTPAQELPQAPVVIDRPGYVWHPMFGPIPTILTLRAFIGNPTALWIPIASRLTDLGQGSVIRDYHEGYRELLAWLDTHGMGANGNLLHLRVGTCKVYLGRILHGGQTPLQALNGAKAAAIAHMPL